MNARDYSALPVGKVAPAPYRIPAPRPQILDEAVVQPDYEAMDWTADYAQTYRPAKPADTDDVFSEDEDADDADALRELLAASPTPTPNGKWVGIAMDACAQLIELQRLIGELDFFSAGDTGLGRLQQEAQRANEVLQRAGYRNGAEA